VHNRRGLRRRVTALLVALGLVATLSISQSIGSTDAAWKDAEYAQAVALTAGLATPTSDSCAITLGTLSASWDASSRPSAVSITYSYRILSASGRVAVGPTSVGSNTSLSRTLGLLGLGDYTLEISATSSGLQSAPLRARLSLVTSLIAACTWL
jgi:hypothetical protein